MKKLIKALPVILLLSFVITCVSINVFAEEPAPALGDVNADRKIDAADALAVLKHAAKISQADVTLSDINKNGTVDATDALWILKYAARLIPDFSDETLNTTPAPTATPEPVATNIANVKNHVKTNGYQEESVYYIPYAVSEDDTMYAFIVYYTDEDILQLELSYYEEFDTGEISYIDLCLPITNNDTESFFYAGSAKGDDYEYFEATAPIDPDTFSPDSTVNYTVVVSENIIDSDVPGILADASTLTTDSLILWDYMLSEELGIGLKDFGFINY